MVYQTKIIVNMNIETTLFIYVRNSPLKAGKKYYLINLPTVVLVGTRLRGSTSAHPRFGVWTSFN